MVKYIEDKNTVKYFDKYTPSFYESKLKYVTKALNRYCQKASLLVDIGCGTGNTLEFIKNETKLQNIYGIDISQNCLLKTQGRLNCETFLGSILDSKFLESLPIRFDFALLSSVLHHLIGKTRKESFSYALLAISNSLKLLKDDGLLFIVEPVFYSTFIFDIIFYIKKIVTKVTSRRIHILSRDTNIGAPVTSFYTIEQLHEMIGYIRNCQIIDIYMEERQLNIVMRLALITRRADTTIVVRKNRIE